MKEFNNREIANKHAEYITEKVKTLRFLVHQEVDVEVKDDKDILEVEAELEKDYPGFFVGFLEEVENENK